MYMKAAVLEKINEPLVIKELQIPKLGYGQVLVKVMSSGICGAQIGEITGAKGKDKYLPHLLGHEGGGIVIEIGEGVTRLKKDDHVVMHWREAFGLESDFPEYLDSNNNKIGAGLITTFNEFAVVSENRLSPIKKDIPFDIAALMGCAVTTGLGVIFNDADLKKGESIAIAGCGGVGLMAIQGARIAGASKIIAIDVYAEKLRLAEQFGATETINSCHVKSKEIQQTDVFVDCTGNVSVIEQGYSIAKKTILVGQPRYGQDLILPNMSQNYCGKILMDSQGGDTDPETDVPYYLELYKRKEIDLDALITDIYPLEKINYAIEEIKTGVITGRCVLEMNN